MVSFTSSAYQVPGVYVQGSSASVVTAGVTPATTVTIVGPSRGYQLATETFALTGTPRALANRGVLPNGVAVDLKVVSLTGAVLVENTDYTLVRGPGAADATTIARVNTSTAIAEGDLVTVSYSFADATYYSPKTFTDQTSVETVYGASLVSVLPTDPNASQVYSPLSLAARLAFENGATNVICVATEAPTAEVNLSARYTEAYAKIAANPDVTLLVPVFSAPSGMSASAYATLFQSLVSTVRADCVARAAEGFGRIAFVGPDTLIDSAGVAYDSLASGIAERRVDLAYPPRMQFYNSALAQTIEVGGCYVAAALAGLLAAQDPNRGLTRLQVYGFTGIPDDLIAEMTSAYKNTLSAAGVTVVEPGRSGQLIVRHGTSTDPSDIVSSEISVTRSQDILYRMVSDGIDGAGLIGTPIDDETTTSVKSIVAGILETAIANLVISDYTTLLVRQQSAPTGNPTVIEVQFTYIPFLPLNYITVSFAMDLNTGQVLTADGTVSASSTDSTTTTGA